MESDLSKEAPEVDTASLWYVSEIWMWNSSNLSFHMVLILPSLGVEKIDISENLL